MLRRVEQAVGAERAEAVTLLLIAIADRLADQAEPLAAEIASLREQLGALSQIV